MPKSSFKFKQFTIFHDKCAMKVGTDGVLLGAWPLTDESVFVAQNLIIVSLYILHRFTDLATEISKAYMKIPVLTQ